MANAYNLNGYPIVVFKNCGGVNVPLQPWPQTFYVCREMFVDLTVELRPLTVTGFLKGVSKNFITMNFWRLCHLLYKIGFLDVPEGTRFSIKYWRWAFWKTFKRREEYLKAARERLGRCSTI